MKPYIEKRGMVIVTDEANLMDPIMFTKKLLDFKAEIDTMIDYSFNNDMKFQKGRDDSFTTFMITSKILPQHLAAYSDNELKVGLKGLSNTEVD